MNFVDIKQKSDAEVPVYNLRKHRYPLPELTDVPSSPKRPVKPVGPEPAEPISPAEPRYELRSHKPSAPPAPNPQPTPVDPVNPVDPETEPRYNLRSCTPAAPAKAHPAVKEEKVIGTIRFKTVSLVQRHGKQHKNLKCPVCKRVAFTFVKKLNLHIKQKHSEHKWVCKHCGDIFSMENACYKHELAHGFKKHICSHCQKGI